MTDNEFAREQRLLDLAIALKAGTATPQEIDDAANHLSYVAGRRLALERQVDAYELALAYIMRVLRLFHDHNIDLDLTWRMDRQYAPITFFVDCSDTFDWGTVDVEELTPERLHVMEQVVADLSALNEGHFDYVYPWAATLYAARLRGQRPRPEIQYPNPHVKALLDACGPERTPGPVNGVD